MTEPERRDVVNDDLTLIQRSNGLRFGTDALLLAAYVQGCEKLRAIELGAGTGIVSLLLATRRKVASVCCVEIQPAYAALCRRNAEENALADRVSVLCADVRALTAAAGIYDVAVANPPYMKTDVPPCDDGEKQIARHEVHGGIHEFAAAAGRLLRHGGRFFCVYRPDRLVDLFAALRAAGLEPKRMTLVHAAASAPPSMVLVEARRGGKSALRVTRPLIIGGDLAARADSPDMVEILTDGRFPKDYA